jgi:prevent-host-death family protein
MSASISAADANRHFSQLLRGVREEMASYIVTSHGKPVARIVPYVDAGEDESARREAARQRMLARWSDQSGAGIPVTWARADVYEDDF